jgi:hypothetical protein
MRIWHPGLEADGGEAFSDVPEGAVSMMRQSGWLLATERDGHLEALAAHQARADEESKPGRSRARSDQAGGGKAGGDNPEGS